MNAVKKIIRLDLLSIRPYMTPKNLLILIGLGLWYAFSTKSAAAVLGVCQMFAVLYASYPFMVGDKSGIDSLYRMFGIRAKSVVLGRYLSALLVQLACLLLGLSFSLLGSAALKTFGSAGLLADALPLFLIGILLAACQFPFFFKYGYAKAKTIMMALYLSIGLLALLSARLKPVLAPAIAFFEPRRALFVISLLILVSALLAGSVLLSIRWYQKKDLAS